MLQSSNIGLSQPLYTRLTFAVKTGAYPSGTLHGKHSVTNALAYKLFFAAVKSFMAWGPVGKKVFDLTKQCV